MSARGSGAKRRPRLVFVVTDSITARYLLRGQLSYLDRAGFEVHLVCSPGRHLAEVAAGEGIRCHGVPMQREIRPLADLRSLYALFRLLRRLRPEIVNASTPKAALLGMLAARLARVPCRILTVRGLRLETTGGWKRGLLSLAERTASSCAHRIVCVSESLRREYLSRGLAAPEKTIVLGAGSSNGVDLARFRPAADRDSEALRRSLELAPGAPTVGFVGRLVGDKGIGDLVRAFERVVLERLPGARLLVLGEIEAADPVSDEALAFLREGDTAITPGFVEDTAPWYRAMDVVAFPSYREGFPNVPLEAAASALPTVGYSATGTVDAVRSGETGQLEARGDWRALGKSLCRYLEDGDLRRRHGAAALERVRLLYSTDVVWEGWRLFYSDLSPHSDRHGVGRRFYPARGKRLFDVVLAGLGLVVLIPLLTVLGLLILVLDGTPVLFRQVRPGRNELSFTLIKFRTMKPAAKGVPDGERLTWLGRLLRRSSLDELPSLWNVLRGEMSLVGPRPLLVEYLPRYSEEQRRRHRVRPGLTGWAQVRGRNALSWEEKFRHDVWYVDNLSFSLDLKILAMTLREVLRGRGVNAPGHTTMYEFEGSGSEPEPRSDERPGAKGR